jgi:putative Mg2+ transporter-C (MgtC) family protein
MVVRSTSSRPGIIRACPSRWSWPSGWWAPPCWAGPSGWSERPETSRRGSEHTSWSPSCLFTLISAHGFGAVLADDPQARFDPTRIAAQIVTGIGFLGAGAILRSGMSVRGLTTAASLWVVAAIGLAVGAGAYVLAAAATVVTLLALLALRPLRSRLVRGRRQEREEFIVEAGPDLELEVLVARVKAAVDRIEHIRVEEEGESQHVALILRLPAGRRPEDVLEVLTNLRGVRNVDWTG